MPLLMPFSTRQPEFSTPEFFVNIKPKKKSTKRKNLRTAQSENFSWAVLTILRPKKKLTLIILFIRNDAFRGQQHAASADAIVEYILEIADALEDPEVPHIPKLALFQAVTMPGVVFL